MTTKSLLFIFSAVLLSCCAEKSNENDAIRVDSIAPVPEADTLGFVGKWKGSYTEYADKFNIDLEIKKTEGDACPEYFCIWTQRNQHGGNVKTYTWCLAPDHDVIWGTGNMGVDNTNITIYKNYEDGSIIVSIRFPGRPGPWDVSFVPSAK